MKLTQLLLSASLIAAAGTAQATSLLPCNLNDVKVTSVAQYSDTTAGATLTTIASNLSLNAAACAGAYSGNDGYYPQDNLGWQNDGLLNGGFQVSTGRIIFPNGAFITDAHPLSDLDNDGAADDPGWIMLGKFDPSKGTFTPSAVGGDTSIVLSSFFTATVDSAGKGSWALTPDANVAQRASTVLGKNYFDQFALVFKSANAFAVYDFTAEQFGVTHPTAATPVMNWAGTYDVTGTLRAGGKDGLKNPAGLSHITVWARDPAAVETSVPEPGTLALLGIAAIGALGASRRRTR